MIATKPLSRRVMASSRVALCALAATVIGCGGASDGGGGTGLGGGRATGGSTGLGGNTTGAGGSFASRGGASATGGHALGGGGAQGGGASSVGGTTTVGRGGSTTAEGGTTTVGRGGSTTAEGGTTTVGRGGSTTAEGGTTTVGRGGSATAEGGTTTVGSGGSTTAEGGTTTVGSGGSTIAEGGTTTADGGSAQGGTTNVELDPEAIFVAPDATEGASGTLDDPMTLSAALGRVTAGGTIYVRGGVYASDSTVSLNQSGREGSPIHLHAYPLDTERPLFDFSAMPENSSNRGMSLSGDYWDIYGIDLRKAGDNCMFVSGSNNLIEYSTFSECADSGLQLGGGAANNLIVNCDSFYNADSSLENADGFAAKLDVGSGNKFVGCRSWNNLDDGWDGYLRPADNVTTTYENCWAIDNGKLKDGSVGAGDGNGFKTGGSDDKDLSHHATYRNCIAAGNVNDGFDHNSNRGNVTILNCAAHDNGTNINFSTSNIAASLIIKNTISFGSNGELNATKTDIANNSWQNGVSVTEDDFVSVDTSLLKMPRKSDGSLPDIDYLKLVPDSDLRNAGVDVGLPYDGPAPDIGPTESVE